MPAFVGFFPPLDSFPHICKYLGGLPIIARPACPAMVLPHHFVYLRRGKLMGDNLKPWRPRKTNGTECCSTKTRISLRLYLSLCISSPSLSVSQCFSLRLSVYFNASLSISLYLSTSVSLRLSPLSFSKISVSVLSLPASLHFPLFISVSTSSPLFLCHTHTHIHLLASHPGQPWNCNMTILIPLR